MSDEPTRPDEPEPAAGVEASPQVDQSNEPVEPTNVQEPEMSTVQIGQADTVPEEKKPEAEESEKAVAPDAPAPDELVQEVAKTESSVKASTEPADSKSEFPLADSNILAELKAGETRAGEAAKAIQALKEQLATNTKKDVMTEEDIQNMEQKQKELMDKMQEFEEITKQIQQLVGLVDVPSSQLGIPKTPMVPAAEDKPKDSTNQLKVQPIDKLPKVIIFGTSDIDEVPRIIVCEPTSARSGKHPLYNQIKNDDVNEKAASKSKITDQGTEDQDQSRTPSPPINQFMNFGYTGRQGNMGPGQPGMMQPGMGQGGMLCPGMGQGGMVQPSFGPPGMVMQPGMGQPGMTQPWTVQPGMMQYLAAQPVWPQLLGLAQPGMPQGRGIEKPRMCSPCGHPRKRKSHKTRDATDSGVKESGQEASRSKTDGDEMKKICRKRKQCICQISGLCTWNTNKPPFPHNRRSRLTKRENDTAVVKSLGQQSEESLRGNRLQKLERKKESSSETSLLLYKQLNKVIDVLKYEFNSRTEGPTLRANPVTRIAADRDSSVKMADEPKMSLEEEIKIVFEAVELEPDVTQKKQILLEEKKKLSIEKEQHEKELNDLDSEQTKKQQELDAADDDMVREVLQNQLAQVQENRKRVAAEWENLVQALNQVGQAFADLVTSFFVTGTQEGVEEEEETLPQSKSEANEDEDLRDEDATAEKQEVGIAESVVVAPALIDEVTPPAGGPPGPPPPGPPPTPDGKPKATPDESDFPLYDAAVLKELREADERAAKAAKAIEAVREQLAVYAKKDEMTDEDIKMMEEKQKELMAKMEEFEEITKKVQHLVGLVDVASSQLGPPQKPMLPNVGVKQGGPGVSSQPEDTLPKVIVCGTGDIDQVPKIIVCEPTKARDGKHPLYHQIQGKHKDGTSKTAVQDLSNKDIPDQAGGYPGTSGVPNGFPGSPSGYPGSPGGYPSGFPGPSMSGYPGGMGGYPGQPFPGSSGGFGMAGLGMPGFPGAVMHGLGGLPNMGGGLPGMLLPGGMPAPVCGPCQPNKPKKHKSHKKKETCPATCPENCQELEEMLEATLNMSEKLAEQNTELEGSRYELQEAVLNKDKQYDGLALQLESMKMELKNLKNENRYLKNTVAKSAPGHGEAQGDQHRCPCSEKTGMKKTGGLCRKELNTMPMCKAQAYKEMGLPIPRPDNRAPCPGAKFAASMGWNENQGCRNELSKSVNCPDMQGSTSRCVCSTKGPGHCPMHSGRSANPAPQPPNMGSGDIGGANCPCGCLGQAAHCKKADMVSPHTPRY